MSQTITFDKSAASHVLKAFDKKVDEKGYVVDEESEDRVTNMEGIEIQENHFAGMEQGSVIFLDDDFNTLVDHVKRRER